ncbi:hypothetical protein HDU87_006315 [Geranomyces variabilis]|uniref:CCDC92/74 N-terminal domain-containing protein n=1 Tax=Geranomyces variabilis TaxID=109894 RepID=A0AAD5XL42_9FUNG|nr:hypothetical protein HDU87_006315 [Geranomyces variabilis]
MPAAVASPPSAVHSSEFVRACSGSSAGFRPVTSANGGNLSNPARHLPPRPTSTTAINVTATSVSQTTQQPRPPSVPPHHPQQQAPPHSPRSAARISALERTIEYMQVQHTALLKGLHEEVAKLQLICSDLSVELVKTKALAASSPVSNADDDALRDIDTYGINADISKPTDGLSPINTTTTTTTFAGPERLRAELPPVTRAPHAPTGRGRGHGVLTRRLLDSPSQSAAALAAEEILAAYVAAATGEGNAAVAVGAAASAKLVVLPPIRYDADASEDEDVAERAI